MAASPRGSDERAMQSAQPSAPRTGSGRRANVVFALVVIAIVAGATFVRVLPLRVDLPYSAYVDEQEVLRPAAAMISDTTWKPDRYNYPPLTMYATAAFATLLWALPGGPNLRGAARQTVRDPIASNIHSTDLIVAGRLVVLLCALATVVLVAILTARVRDRRAAGVAALLTAAMPALLTRSAIVIVDTVAACLTTACLCCVSFITKSPRPVLWTALAGVAAGLSAAAKYPSGAVIVAVVVVIAMASERTVRERAVLFAVAIGGAVTGAVAGAPTLLLQTGSVLRELRHQAQIYDGKTTTSYWHEVRNPKEVGLLVGVLAVVGVVVLLRDRRSRPLTLGALAFATVLVAWLSQYSFEPFRNVLPILPIVCAAAGTAVVAIADACIRAAHLGAKAGIALVVVLAVVTSAVMIDAVWSSYLDQRVHVHDSRVEARNWLASRVGAGDDVLVARELGFLPRELRRLSAPTAQRSLAARVSARAGARYDYVVIGDAATARRWGNAIADRRLLAAFGTGPTFLQSSSYRLPWELVRIYGTVGR